MISNLFGRIKRAIDYWAKVLSKKRVVMLDIPVQPRTTERRLTKPMYLVVEYEFQSQVRVGYSRQNPQRKI